MNLPATSEALPHKPIRRKILKEVILDWPEPPVPFPERIPLPAAPPWPLLVAPWRGGFQCLYDPASGLFHYPHQPPLWNYFNPNSEYILMGEIFRPDMLAPEYLIRYLLNNFAGTDFPLQAGLFQVNDTAETDRNAAQRASHVVNLGPQPSEVVVPALYQASGPESLGQYLQMFRGQGYLGAICRTLESEASDPQFIVIDPIPVPNPV